MSTKLETIVRGFEKCWTISVHIDELSDDLINIGPSSKCLRPGPTDSGDSDDSSDDDLYIIQ